MRRTWLAVVAVAAVLLAGTVWRADGAPYTVGAAGTGPNVDGHAVLTFDDCPYAPWAAHFHSARTANARTAAQGLRNFRGVVATARRAGVAVVVAPTGLCEARYKAAFHVDLAAIARQNGMWVIGHSYDHQRYTSISDQAVATQLRRSVPTFWSRPPYGAYDARVGRVMTASGRAVWNWTFTTRDWTGLSRATVVDRATRGCTTGQTCLLHMQWNGFNPSAVRDMIAGMARAGSEACHLQTTPDGAVVATTPFWHQLACGPKVEPAPAA